MWETEVISNKIVNGLLKVEVRFTKDGKSFVDRYETRSAQDGEWLNDNIKRRINDLEGIELFTTSIPTGKIKVENPPPKEKTDRDIYYGKLQEFNKLISVARKQLITEDHPEFKDTHKWLKDNFKPEYIDLF
jgi:hypothetical protein